MGIPAWAFWVLFGMNILILFSSGYPNRSDIQNILSHLNNVDKQLEATLSMLHDIAGSLNVVEGYVQEMQDESGYEDSE